MDGEDPYLDVSKTSQILCEKNLNCEDSCTSNKEEELAGTKEERDLKNGFKMNEDIKLSKVF